MKTIKSVNLYTLSFLRCSFSLIFLLAGFHSFAQQHSLYLKVNIPSSHVGDTIYIAGNFNDWNPGNAKYQLTKLNDTYTIDISGLKEDVYQFKFTRGDWGKVEVHANASAMDNRLVKLTTDTTLEYTIEGWQDDFAPVEKQHTASLHVHILDTAFFIPQLNRTRRVWIYLPEDYARSKNKKHYPVLYMHDGQNIFDEYTSGFGEWGVDECLDTLIAQGKPACIVVGIDCGPKRINEYNPYYLEKYGEGEGDQYVDFLVKTLKPFIDKHYRTLTNKDKTIIAGSSMGGLISYYAMLTHPDIFGNAGVFSPSFWTAPQIKNLTDSIGDNVKGKIFFYMGNLEGDSDLIKLKDIADSIGKKSDAVIYTVIDPVGRHNEQAWRKWFAEFYCWVMSDGFNSPVKLEK